MLNRLGDLVGHPGPSAVNQLRGQLWRQLDPLQFHDPVADEGGVANSHYVSLQIGYPRTCPIEAGNDDPLCL
jgi:hypothetical protein